MLLCLVVTELLISWQCKPIQFERFCKWQIDSLVFCRLIQFTYVTQSIWIENSFSPNGNVKLSSFKSIHNWNQRTKPKKKWICIFGRVNCKHFIKCVRGDQLLFNTLITVYICVFSLFYSFARTGKTCRLDYKKLINGFSGCWIVWVVATVVGFSFLFHVIRSFNSLLLPLCWTCFSSSWLFHLFFSFFTNIFFNSTD